MFTLIVRVIAWSYYYYQAKFLGGYKSNIMVIISMHCLKLTTKWRKFRAQNVTQIVTQMLRSICYIYFVLSIINSMRKNKEMPAMKNA